MGLSEELRPFQGVHCARDTRVECGRVERVAFREGEYGFIHTLHKYQVNNLLSNIFSNNIKPTS